MSFGESVFAGEFNRKTIKVDLFVKVNHIYPRWYRLGKILEDTTRVSTEDGAHLSLRQDGWPYL
jgi:hypothetical protein